MAESMYEKTALNSIKRFKERAIYDKETVHAIVRAVPVLHCAFVDGNGRPQCVPMMGVIDETEDGEVFLYLHGSTLSRFFKQTNDAVEMCISATIVDGYKLALTPFHHGAQYRSAVLHGTTFPFNESYDGLDVEKAKFDALEKLTNAVLPERWQHSRVPTSAEVRTTGVVRLRVESASAKVTQTEPKDDAHDMEDMEMRKRVWTGVLPFETRALDPVPSSTNLVKDVPEHVKAFQAYYGQLSKGGMPKA